MKLFIIIILSITCISKIQCCNSWYYFQISKSDTIYFEIYKVHDSLVFFNDLTNGFFIEKLTEIEINQFSDSTLINKISRFSNIPKKEINISPISPSIELINKVLSDFEYLQNFEFNFSIRAGYHKAILQSINRYCRWDEYGHIEQLGYFDNKGLKDGVWLDFNGKDAVIGCKLYDSGKLIKAYDPPCYK